VLRTTQPHGEPREAGISLLEVLMAVSLLGMSFATIFSGLSAALRTTDRLDRFDRASDFGARKLSELILDPSLVAGQMRSGVSPSGIAWQARTQLVDTRPLPNSDKPARLVQITLELEWRTRSGRQSLSLETLKLCIPESPPSP
jgi:type II secretory pathway pseudopilin PulG